MINSKIVSREEWLDARGLDMLNGDYRYMDLAPRGRDEDALEWTMAWLERRDEYG